MIIIIVVVIIIIRYAQREFASSMRVIVTVTSGPIHMRIKWIYLQYVGFKGLTHGCFNAWSAVRRSFTSFVSMPLMRSYDKVKK
jgi:hypothetical protein